jgi:hypothetical protein
MFSVDRQLPSRDFAPSPLPWSCHAQRSLWGFSAMSGTLACGATQKHTAEGRPPGFASQVVGGCFYYYWLWFL